MARVPVDEAPFALDGKGTEGKRGAQMSGSSPCQNIIINA
jgi:hypothetical protein